MYGMPPLAEVFSSKNTTIENRKLEVESTPKGKKLGTSESKKKQKVEYLANKEVEESFQRFEELVARQIRLEEEQKKGFSKASISNPKSKRIVQIEDDILYQNRNDRFIRRQAYLNRSMQEEQVQPNQKEAQQVENFSPAQESSNPYAMHVLGKK